MAMIAEHIGDIDVPAAFKILHQDKRWSGTPAAMASYVFPGCGYGGYCLPKDTAALSSIAKENGFEAKILDSNLHVNESIKEFAAEKIAAAVPKDQTIGILGLSFKGGSDDVRLSPSKFIIEKLLEKGFTRIVAYDPMANEVFAKEFSLPITYAHTLESLVAHADQLVLLTNWPEFKMNKPLITSKPLFDFRYAFAELPNSLVGKTLPA
jgi:UDPglucose 6-dehydrogenase